MNNLLNKATDIPAGKISWNQKYKFKEDEWEDFLTHFTKGSMVQWFQNIINHKILATNTLLYKIKLIGDPKCTFCTKNRRKCHHFLWEFERVK